MPSDMLVTGLVFRKFKEDKESMTDTHQVMIIYKRLKSPTLHCVEEMGRPNFVEARTVIAAPNSIENPEAGVIFVKFSATV